MAKQDTAMPATPIDIKDRTITWNDSQMQTSYANVVNVAGTREEITLLFGTNQTWQGAQKNLAVLLSNRIVLSPYAAKRCHMLLGAALKQYEGKFGDIVIEQAPAQGTH